MARTETTSMKTWQEADWQILPYSIPAVKPEPPLPFFELVDAERVSWVPDVELLVEAEIEDEALFGTHLKEAARTIRRLISRSS